MKRLNSDISIVDAVICDNLKNLRKAINVFVYFQEKYPDEEAFPYYPQELSSYVSFGDLTDSWMNKDFITVQTICIEGWIKYSHDTYGEYPYYTVEEFLQNVAQRKIESMILKSE